MAFGDQHNDLEMLDLGGHRASPWATPIPKSPQPATTVAATHAEDGVAQVIEALLAGYAAAAQHADTRRRRASRTDRATSEPEGSRREGAGDEPPKIQDERAQTPAHRQTSDRHTSALTPPPRRRNPTGLGTHIGRRPTPLLRSTPTPAGDVRPAPTRATTRDRRIPAAREPETSRPRNYAYCSAKTSLGMVPEAVLVMISTPSGVTTRVCSNWAERRPSGVTAVQSSSQT